MPSGLEEAQPVKGKYIVGHSETGHHHVIEANPDRVKMFNDPKDPMTSYLQVIADDVKLEHLRDHDTHETLLFGSMGFFKVHRQREHTPQGFRMARD